jgi:predicted branched-subunit amino acid permease
MGAMNMVVLIASFIVIAAASFVSAKLHNFWLFGLVLAWMVVVLVAWSYLMNVASLVFKGALYLYAAEGTISEPYDQQLLDSAWKFKR